jgi:hypothetical protein
MRLTIKLGESKCLTLYIIKFKTVKNLLNFQYAEDEDMESNNFTTRVVLYVSYGYF